MPKAMTARNVAQVRWWCARTARRQLLRRGVGNLGGAVGRGRRAAVTNTLGAGDYFGRSACWRDCRARPRSGPYRTATCTASVVRTSWLLSLRRRSSRFHSADDHKTSAQDPSYLPDDYFHSGHLDRQGEGHRGRPPSTFIAKETLRGDRPSVGIFLYLSIAGCGWCVALSDHHLSLEQGGRTARSTPFVA